jgi:DNA repair exonuclease SbcCD nuclease subunit
MTTILFIGDVHFQMGNINECEVFIQKMVALANERKPSIIIVGGDVLHTHERVHTIALNIAYSFIHQLSLISKTYVLVGNHDYISNQEFLTENHWMNGMKDWNNVVIVDYVCTVIKEDYKFMLAPYVPVGKFIEALNTSKEEWRDANCIFGHQEFYGCKMGAIVSEVGDRWPDEYPYVVSGHIHSKQTPQPNIYYSGSAMQHAFGESENNTIVMLTFTKDSPVYYKEEIDLDMPIKKIIYTDIEKIKTIDYEALVCPRVDGLKNSIKLTLTGDISDYNAIKKTKRYKNMISSGIKINFKQNTRNPLEQVVELVNKDPSVRFSEILFESILAHNDNPYMSKIYEYVVNNRTV